MHPTREREELQNTSVVHINGTLFLFILYLQKYKRRIKMNKKTYKIRGSE